MGGLWQSAFVVVVMGLLWAAYPVLRHIALRMTVKWRAIETAPKDGTRVLLTDGKFVGTGAWREVGLNKFEWDIDGEQGDACPWANDYMGDVVAWAPLPTPTTALVRRLREKEESMTVPSQIDSSELANVNHTGVANLVAILDDQPYANSALSVYQIRTILANEGGFLPSEAVMWFREWEANPRVLQRKDPEVDRLRAVLGTVRDLAFSDEPAEELEKAQDDLRLIHKVAIEELNKNG